jgi:DNA-binding NarL/FixJ family response regulator
LDLNISERAVKAQLSNIFKKLRASNRTEAVAIAIRHGLIPR